MTLVVWLGSAQYLTVKVISTQVPVTSDSGSHTMNEAPGIFTEHEQGMQPLGTRGLHGKSHSFERARETGFSVAAERQMADVKLRVSTTTDRSVHFNLG